jgi:hypothetical protein
MPHDEKPHPFYGRKKDAAPTDNLALTRFFRGVILFLVVDRVLDHIYEASPIVSRPLSESLCRIVMKIAFLSMTFVHRGEVCLDDVPEPWLAPIDKQGTMHQKDNPDYPHRCRNWPSKRIGPTGQLSCSPGVVVRLQM